jgi:hypothetical protein
MLARARYSAFAFVAAAGLLAAGAGGASAAPAGDMPVRAAASAFPDARAAQAGGGGVAGALAASTTAKYSAAVLASSPWAYWRLNEKPQATKAADDTGNGRAGKYASCVQLGQPGPIKNDSDTAGFFGNPGCWMSYTPSAAYAGAYSVEAWVKPGSASKTYQTIFDTRGPNGEFSFDLSLEGTGYSGGKNLHIDVGDGQTWLTNFNGGFNAPFPFTVGRWYYIAATVNLAQSVAFLYVNGNVLAKIKLPSYGHPTLLFDPSHPIAIGGNPRYDLIPGNTLPGNFEGTIGQAAVYTRALTAATIAAHYKAGGYALSGTDHLLNGDSCPTATFCMAVGSYVRGGGVPGLSEVLSGGKWVVKPVPSPSRGSNVFANEVSCSSAKSCLFVGQHWAGTNGNGENLAEAWNGTAWRIVAAAAPSATSFSSLNDVACPTSKFCLAVGDAGTSANHYHDTAYTWVNRTSWRQISVPGPTGSRNSGLYGLACSDAAHCMAVGNYTSATGHYLPFAADWTSGHWRILALPAIAGQAQVIPEGVSCPTANECVAVGFTIDTTTQGYYHAFAYRWSGGTWHLSTLRGAPSLFVGVSCPSAGRCFASGYTYPSITGHAHQLLETWNGSAWTAQQPAETAGLAGILQHVSCAGPASCEAVGHNFYTSTPNSNVAVTEAWNGTRWLGQVTPNP